MITKIGDKISCDVEVVAYEYSLTCPFCSEEVEGEDSTWGSSIDAYCDECGAKFSVDIDGDEATVTQGPDQEWLDEQEQQD